MKLPSQIVILLTTVLMSSSATPHEAAVVLENYADIAHAMYEDASFEAANLGDAIDRLVSNPSEDSMRAARAAWIQSRVPYQQTEVYRFGNATVDDWEGKVNAWPLDEGLIDYVDVSYGTYSDNNPMYNANVVANKMVTLGGTVVDASTIDSSVLAKLHEVGEVEANVAIGYHAIEFLLWGQDLNGTRAGSGNRPWTDYAKGSACTNHHCTRRAAYLKTASHMLIDELNWMTSQWVANGETRVSLLAGGAKQGLAKMLTGLGSLSYGELAGERMKLGLLLHDPEEEHDCFSDNTHNSHYYDVMGMLAVYRGTYTRTNGSKVSGPSLYDLVAEKEVGLAEEMDRHLGATQAAMAALKARAETHESYDQMIGADNIDGNATVQNAIDRLSEQTKLLERVVVALDLEPIEWEGSDSLDNPGAIFE